MEGYLNLDVVGLMLGCQFQTIEITFLEKLCSLATCMKIVGSLAPNCQSTDI
jgi:hypothetical protein